MLKLNVLLALLLVIPLAALPAVRLLFVPVNLTLQATVCTPDKVVITDNLGKITPIPTARSLYLDAYPASIALYKDTKCTLKIGSSVPLAAGTSEFQYYMRATTPGLFLMRVYMSGFSAIIQRITVTQPPPPPPPTGGGIQDPPTTAPAPALSQGYTRLAFFDEFNNLANVSPDGSGNYKWYRTNFYSASATLPASALSAANGTLRIATDASGYSDGIATAAPGHTDTVFNHGFFEARMRFNPNGHTGGAWPAFWGYAIEGILGTVGEGGHFGELDFMECYPLRKPCTPITTVHDWTWHANGNTQVQNSNNIPTYPAGTDLSQFHTYGSLWTPNRIQFYFDGVLIGAVTVPTGPGTQFVAIESQHLVVILGTGANWPLDVDFVRIWQ